MIVKDIAQYEETDSELAKFTINNLHSEIDRLKEELDKTRLSELDKEYRISKAIEYNEIIDKINNDR